MEDYILTYKLYKYEYSKKQEMLSIKQKLDSADGEEYDKLYESLQKALSEISPLTNWKFLLLSISKRASFKETS